MREFFVIFYCQSVRIAYNEKYKPKIYLIVVVGVAMIGWGFEWNQDITNDKRVGTVVRDIGVMVLATGIIFVMQRAVNNPA